MEETRNTETIARGLPKCDGMGCSVFPAGRRNYVSTSPWAPWKVQYSTGQGVPEPAWRYRHHRRQRKHNPNRGAVEGRQRLLLLHRLPRYSR